MTRCAPGEVEGGGWDDCLNIRGYRARFRAPSRLANTWGSGKRLKGKFSSLGTITHWKAGTGQTLAVTTQVLAHRGASSAEPENTVQAFRRAVEMGAHAAELDVRRTVDGVLVVHHNPHLADGRVICQVPAAELPESVPTLDRALDACGPMWVNIEIKNDPNEPDFDVAEDIATATVACLMQRADDPERWLISSFRRETIDRCHQVAPDIATAWLTPGVDAHSYDSVLTELAAAGHSALHPWVGLVTKELIDACHRHGLAVNTWTCDDPERMVELKSWAVDGICTNVPDVALRALADL